MEEIVKGLDFIVSITASTPAGILYYKNLNMQ